jgi:hypothetical protein
VQPLTLLVKAAPVVVVAHVTAASDGDATLIPEAFLKGAATTDPISLHNTDTNDDCMAPNFTLGQRVVAIIEVQASGDRWPPAGGVYELEDGKALSTTGRAYTTEADLIQQIRSQTDQYAVPAQTKAEGASIDWTKTVLPVGVALLVVFGIGLWLMKIWHRIDPT